MPFKRIIRLKTRSGVIPGYSDAFEFVQSLGMSVFWVAGDVEEEGEGVEERGAEEYSTEESSHFGQAWEIDFGPTESVSKTKKLPKFFSKVRPQRTEKLSVKVTTSPVSTAHMTKDVLGKRGGKIASRSNYQKSTPTQSSVKPRTAQSAPPKLAKSSMTGVRSSVATAKSTIPSRTPTIKSTAPSARIAQTSGSKMQNEPNSSSFVNSKARPASAPTKATRRLTVSSKPLSSQQKTTPTSSKLAEKSGRKLSSIWKRKDSKEHIKTDLEKDMMSEDGGQGADRSSHRRTLSMVAPQRRAERGTLQEVGRRSIRSNMYQSSEELRGNRIDDGWEGQWGGASSERGFDSSGIGKGSWVRRRPEQLNKIQSQEYSPRLQMTPDLVISKTNDRKLREVQKWIHDVTIQTQQEILETRSLPTLPDGEQGSEPGDPWMAVSPEDMASRKVLDLRRW